MIGLVATAAALIVASSAGHGTDPPSFGAMVEEIAALDLATGLAVAVVRGDSTIYRQCFGVTDGESGVAVDSGTVFYPVMVAAPMLAQAAVALDAAGEIDLDAPLSAVLPELRLPAPASPDSVLLRNLVVQDHGIGTGLALRLRARTGRLTDTVLLAMVERGQVTGPERGPTRTPAGIALLDLAMRRHRDISAVAAIEQRVLEPLGMDESTFFPSRVPRARRARTTWWFPDEVGPWRPGPFAMDPACDEAVLPASGLATTVRDLERWVIACLNDGRLEGEAALAGEVVRSTQERRHTIEGRPGAEAATVGWGYGWFHQIWQGHHRLVLAGEPAVVLIPASDLGLIVLTNGGDVQRLSHVPAVLITEFILADLVGMEVDRDEFLAELTRIRLWKETFPNPEDREAPDPVLPLPVTAYAGVYGDDETGRMHWRVEDDRLAVQMGCVHGTAEFVDGASQIVWVDGLGFCRFESDGDRVGAVSCGSVTLMRTEH